jgi:hypothetical protein
MPNLNKKLAVLIPILILLTGFSLHFAFGFIPVQWFRFPVNFIIGVELLIMIPVLYFLFKNKTAICYLHSGAAAISSIALFTLLTAIMAIFPQNTGEHSFSEFLGINLVLYTWYFSLSAIYLLLALGMITVKRLTAFKIKHIGFYLNHIGLWIIIAGGFLGQADKEEYSMHIPEGETVWFAEDKQGNVHDLDFAFELERFNIEYYQPKIAAFNENGEIIESEIQEINENDSLTIQNRQINIKTLIEHAWFSGDTVLQVVGVPGTVSAAKIKIDGKSHWVSNESRMFPPKYVELPNKTLISLLSKEPKHYSSDIKLFTKSGRAGESHRIAVNKPLRFESKAVYQSSYYINPENTQTVSVLSIVKDPWLPLVYSGIFLLLAGALWMMFAPVKQTKN